MVNLYRRGRIAERKVANSLREMGFENIRRSAGSRGPADIYAVKNDRKYYFQVKSNSARIDSDGIDSLRDLAQSRRGVAVIVHRKNGKNKWSFQGNWSRR